MIFDGKAFVREIEGRVKNKVTNLAKKPKIVSVLVGDDPASEMYTRLKKAAAERVGIQFEIVQYTNISVQQLGDRIREIGERKDVSGVMVQLPLPDVLRGETPKLLEVIPLGKDTDGLRWEESGVKPATVRAVFAILDEIANRKSSEHSPEITQGSELWGKRFVVLGARGSVGRPLCHFLRERGVEVSEVEWDTLSPADIIGRGDVVISCVGKTGVVTGEMVKEGVIAIDVGAPKGDMTTDVYAKALVAVPVPGGVGPVTIACLLQNAVEIYGRTGK